ncbi:MAG: exodeoxyribonuclease VII large subunit [Oscillospiraceae bacterium]|nr:exodeoxyribonuclease VII large subunit [Oscillospiraceae bacterium]
MENHMSVLPISVLQLNNYISSLFTYDDILNGLYVKGEISGIVFHGTGHIFFTLKDKDSMVSAVMFKGQAMSLRFRPQNGMNVIVRCDVKVFARDGKYQLYCNQIEPDGQGALSLEFEQLKEKLLKKGIFDDAHKKPIPAFPRRIAVVTSKTGAVFHDIANVLARRYPIAELMIAHSQVQGDRAESDIADALSAADRAGADVIILARGGGSLEDLRPFNTETVADAIFACKTPVISAVGHETDFTVADLTADLRAPTPSAAAELAAPDTESVKLTLDNYNKLMYNYTISKYIDKKQRLKSSAGLLYAHNPEARVINTGNTLRGQARRLGFAVRNRLTHDRRRLMENIAKAETLSPLSVLMRGYTLTLHEGRIVPSAKRLHENDTITTRFADGTVVSRVSEIVIGGSANAETNI